MNTIILDMYGVILKESKGNFIPYTYRHFDEIEHNRLTRQFTVEKLFTKASSGDISSDEFLTTLGYNDPQFHMRNYIDNFLTLDSGFINFAERFYRKYDFALLSNDVKEWSAYITKRHDLDKYFRLKIISGNVKCRKPDIKIFEITLTALGKKAEDCIFVDNSIENLKTASELGITPILFNRDAVEYSGKTVNTFAELTEIIDNLSKSHNADISNVD